jgi:hypothetical protein
MDNIDQLIKALLAQFQTLLKPKQAGNGCGGRGGSGQGMHCRGQGQARGKSSPGSSSYSRYCKKPGHVQRVCSARIKVGAPEVSAQGKPYSRSSELEQEEDNNGEGTTSNPWGQQQHLNQGEWEELQEVYHDMLDFI